MQALHVPPSSWHSKLEPASEELKLKLALVEDVEPVGPLVIVVLGGVVSTVKVALALVPVLPAASDCRAWTV